jgi:hypothetical protein
LGKDFGVALVVVVLLFAVVLVVDAIVSIVLIVFYLKTVRKNFDLCFDWLIACYKTLLVDVFSRNQFHSIFASIDVFSLYTRLN